MRKHGLISGCLALFASAALASATPEKSTGDPAVAPEQSVPTALRLDDLLWREVRGPSGETLGAVSDVLAEMPSGRIVYVAVVPSDFFQRPKAVPPGALTLPDAPHAPLTLNLSRDRWYNAPILDWNAAQVVNNTAEGRRIYAYYQQRWQDPSDKPWPVVVTPQSGGPAQPARYVSIKKLLLDRVATPAWQQTGFVRDFLVDWPAHRVTYALVSPRFTPLAGTEQTWFAVPVALLNPPQEGDALTVNSSVDAFRQADTLATNQPGTPANLTTIYRYPVSGEDEPATASAEETP